jgi:hypothetical protein
MWGMERTALGYPLGMAAVGDEGPVKPVRTVFVEAVALHRAGRWQDAAKRFDDVLAAVAQGAEDEQTIAVDAAYMKVVCLEKQREFRRALVACDEFLAAFGTSTDPRAIDFGVDVLWLKSQALKQMGDMERAVSVLRCLIERYGDGPPMRPQVARAMYNEGVYLRDKGHGENAIRIWDELFARFSPDPPKSDPSIPIRGQLAKAQILAEAGQFDAALVTCERMLEECDRLHLPEQNTAEVRRVMHGCIAMERRARKRGTRIHRLVKRH